MRTVDAGGLPIGDGHPPRIMGVLNVSEESPYDPSVFADPEAAARYVDRELIDEGADVVDVGLESANKRTDVLTPEEELARLDTAFETLDLVEGDAVFSIETRYAEVADEALSRGFEMVNDVCGFADPAMPDVCREHDAAVVKMASPPDLRRPGAVEETPWAERMGEGRAGEEWAGEASYVEMIYEALRQNGFTEKTIVDPAFGGWSEAKTLADDRETFRRLREFRGHGRPILVSINRKNFLRALAGRSTEEALAVSLAATAMAVERGAHVIRTHDVSETRDAALVGDAFTRERTRHRDEIVVEELDVTRVDEVRRHLERIGADESAAPATTTRIFEIAGLSDGEFDRLARAAVAAGATLTCGREAAILAGTERALARIDSELERESGAIQTVRAWIRGDGG